MKKLIILSLFIVALTGCNSQSNSDLEARIDYLEDEIYSLESQISDLNSRISDSEYTIYNMESDLDDISKFMNDATDAVNTNSEYIEDLIKYFDLPYGWKYSVF